VCVCVCVELESNKRPNVKICKKGPFHLAPSFVFSMMMKRDMNLFPTVYRKDPFPLSP
jgi:hypothetical protein